MGTLEKLGGNSLFGCFLLLGLGCASLSYASPIDRRWKPTNPRTQGLNEQQVKCVQWLTAINKSSPSSKDESLSQAPASRAPSLEDVRLTHQKIRESLAHPDVQNFLKVMQLEIGNDWNEFHDRVSAPVFMMRTANAQLESVPSSQIVIARAMTVFTEALDFPVASHAKGYHALEGDKNELWFGNLRLEAFDLGAVGIVFALMDGNRVVFAASPGGTETGQLQIHNAVLEMYRTGEPPYRAGSSEKVAAISFIMRNL